ncbi:hypothetical protein [uncultured Chryseobacterium sp.]|uniref:hypothetical protein n=1 Tax=uncultured Chryseobacterium sp. TaxID=259322 RepID=UPI0025F8E599|nr:hypothetical protein [uncultured Chryseobacterium sp.]
MDKKLKRFFVKSVVVLLIIHLGYFLYGYVKFKGLEQVSIYTEFYRFKFYDDVSISHFFISGLFLFVFLVILLWKHSRQGYSFINLFKTGAALLLVSFLTFTFFISYSLGMNAKLRHDLPEKDLNKDKTLLNVLRPFLYNFTSYSSEKLFNPEHILYPKPYPVIGQKDSIRYATDHEEYYSIQHTYYSIDTLKVLTSDKKKISTGAKFFSDFLQMDPEEFNKRIISEKVIKDSTEIIYKGQEIQPEYDDRVCIFLENNNLFSPASDLPVSEQQYHNAVERYNLLYRYKQDSLLHRFQKLNMVLKKYNIETQIIPEDLTKDVFYYRDHKKEILNGIRNTFERNDLAKKLKAVDHLFYHPNYLHPSIRMIFAAVVVSVWLVLFLFYLIWNFKNKKKPAAPKKK